MNIILLAVEICFFLQYLWISFHLDSSQHFGESDKLNACYIYQMSLIKSWSQTVFTGTTSPHIPVWAAVFFFKSLIYPFSNLSNLCFIIPIHSALTKQGLELWQKQLHSSLIWVRNCQMCFQISIFQIFKIIIINKLKQSLTNNKSFWNNKDRI